MTAASQTRLECVSTEAARKVAAEADQPSQNHRARADGSVVVLSYFNKRYPLDVADWAFQNGHASDEAAANVIGRL